MQKAMQLMVLLALLFLFAGCATTPYQTKTDLPIGTQFFDDSKAFQSIVMRDWQLTPTLYPSASETVDMNRLQLYAARVTVIGVYTASEDSQSRTFYVAELQKQYPGTSGTSTFYLFAPKDSVDTQIAQDKADQAEWASAQARQQQTLQSSGGAIVSTDGRFKVYIPIETNNTLAEKQNRLLFDLAERQIKNRPIEVSFTCDRAYFDLFVARWMRPNYKFLGGNMTEAYFQDSKEDQDYVIILTILPPGLNLYFMTYEYFAATH